MDLNPGKQAMKCKGKPIEQHHCGGLYHYGIIQKLNTPSQTPCTVDQRNTKDIYTPLVCVSVSPDNTMVF